MPIYKFACRECGEAFTKILPSSDITSVACNCCNGKSLSRVFSKDKNTAKAKTDIPAGALSGGACKSGFS